MKFKIPLQPSTTRAYKEVTEMGNKNDNKNNNNNNTKNNNNNNNNNSLNAETVNSYQRYRCIWRPDPMPTIVARLSCRQ